MVKLPTEYIWLIVSIRLPESARALLCMVICGITDRMSGYVGGRVFGFAEVGVLR
jgi:hypothetical protein